MTERSITSPTTGAVPRRRLLCGALLLGAAGAGVLAGCGGAGGSGDDGGGGGGGGGGDGDGGTGRTGLTASPGTPLAALSDVPVGGGTLVTTSGGDAVLLVQPSAGTVKAYDPTCTHRGTRVPPPENGVMTCPSHGSRFQAADGSVVQGPATRPLREIAVTVTGQQITLA
jgi:nitrite reductase/ring-hydroxylating ferredoxin subunit